jgi:hypothetical protein
MRVEEVNFSSDRGQVEGRELKNYLYRAMPCWKKRAQQAFSVASVEAWNHQKVLASCLANAVVGAWW